MKLASSIFDIQVRVNDMDRLTEWSPVPLGSILRVSDYAYPNWGISIDRNNRNWLYGASQEAYSVEWQKTDNSLNDLVTKASTDAGLGDINFLMNQVIGKEVFDFITCPYYSPKYKEKYVIADIGAGAGATSLAIAKNIFRADSKTPLNFEFLLIEPSSSRLYAASDAINNIKKEMNTIHNVSINCFASRDIDALAMQEENSVDFAVANASIHHNSNTKHLVQISKALRPHAPFIIGDWYDGLSEKPSRIYWMLALISKREDSSFVNMVLSSIEKCEEIKASVKSSELDDFTKYFSLNDSDLRTAFMADNDKWALADAGILKFWLEVGKRFSKKVKSPIYALEGHERIITRRKNLLNSGFYFDEDCKKKYVELSRRKMKGDLATVMVAKKARL
jgi:SAM-dependent methyltransferase